MCRELFRRSVLLTSVIFKVSFFISCRVPTCFDFSKAEIVDRLTAPYRSTRLRLILFSKEDKLRTLLKFKRFWRNSEFDPAFPNCQEMFNCLRFSSSNLVLLWLDCQVSGAVKPYINSINTEREK